MVKSGRVTPLYGSIRHDWADGFLNLMRHGAQFGSDGTKALMTELVTPYVKTRRTWQVDRGDMLPLGLP